MTNTSANHYHRSRLIGRGQGSIHIFVSNARRLTKGTQLIANHRAMQAPQTMTRAELIALQQAVDQVPVPGQIIDTIAQLRRDLGAKGIRVSDRRPHS